MSGWDTKAQRWGGGGGAQAVGVCSNPGPWLSPQGLRVPTEAGGAVSGDETGQAARLSSQSPVCWESLGWAQHRGPGGAPCHPAGLRLPGSEAPGGERPGGPGGRPCSGGGDVLPPRGCVACRHSRGQELGGLCELP